MAIILGQREPRWPSPVSFGTGHYHELVSTGADTYMPGFANDDAAGSTLKITLSSSVNYLTATGASITSGVWNGGLVAADFSGNTHGNWIRGLYMDTDGGANRLWMLAGDAASSPRKLKLCYVDKAGSLTQFPWRDMTSGLDWAGGNCLQKDGDGNLFSIMSSESGASLARGYKFHWGASDGALTTSPLIPASANTMGVSNGFYPMFGPTDNGIYIQITGISPNYGSNQGGAPSGKILNANNGRGSMSILLPNSYGRGPEQSQDIASPGPNYGYYWRGHWKVTGYSGTGNNSVYNVTDMNNFLDSLARDRGIL